jgi:hypothetical protein
LIILSQLTAEFFARSPLLAWPVFALALFLCVFVTVSLRALFGRRDDMLRMAELPIGDAEERSHE